MSQAPGNEIPHTLAALDWGGITCQSGAGCTNRASYVVHLHAVDECNDPDLDPFGNTVEILCIACLWHVEAKVLLQVGRLTRSPGAFCLTCGAPVRAATGWSSLGREYAAVAEELGALLAAVQAGVWQGPSAESFAAACLPYLSWLTQASADCAAAAARLEAVTAAYAAALVAMPTLAELAANHATHGAMVATNFFGITGHTIHSGPSDRHGARRSCGL